MFFKGKENKVQRVNNLPKAIEKMTYVLEERNHKIDFMIVLSNTLL